MHHLHQLLYRREIADLLYFLNVLTIYYDVSRHNNVEIPYNSNLRSGNAGLVLPIQFFKTECFKRRFF